MYLRLNRDRILGPEQIRQIRLRRQIDPIMGRLIPDTMTIRLHRGQSLQQATGKQQLVELLQGDKLLSSQYISRCVQQDQVQTLESRTDLDFLQLEFKGCLYENRLVDRVLEELLGDRNYVLDPAVAPYVSGHIPICSRKEALEMVTFAQGGCMKMDPYGSFSMGILSEENPVLLGQERILEGPVMVSLPAYSRVELVSHSYQLAKYWVQIFGSKEFFTNDKQTYTFTEPVFQYQLEHGEILDSGHNYVEFYPMERDTLHTLPYLHSRSWLSNSQLPGCDRVLSVRDNTLIGSHNDARILEQMHRRAQLNHQLKLRIYVENEKPGQAVAVDTPWGSRFAGVITRMDSLLTPERHTAEITICGREV